MKLKVAFFASLILVAGLVLGSCNNNNESQRSVVTVTSINGNAPFLSDVLDQGDSTYTSGGAPVTQDDFVMEDWVPVVFKNRSYLPGTMGPNEPLSDFIITRYRVEWRWNEPSGGLGLPPPHDGATSLSIPSGEEVLGFFLLVPYEVKNSALMTAINYLNPGPPPGAWPDEYLMIASITFWGHEVGSEDEWEIPIELTVNFADPVVPSEE